MTRSAMALSAAVFVVLATPASADELTVRGRHAADDAFIRVGYGDLQLAQMSDAAELKNRVNQAIRRGCNDLYGTSEVSQKWACLDIATNAAAPQVDNAIAAARSGHSVAVTNFVLRFARR